VEQLTYLSATALAKAIRYRQLSSREVVEAHLAESRLSTLKLNAVAQLVAEDATREAAAADDALARGEPGSLHGVPFTVKDWIETARCRLRSRVLERKDFYTPSRRYGRRKDARAGAIMLAKTIDGHDNPVYGHPNNPYDLTALPAAAAAAGRLIAAGASPLGLGSDSGGSIRYPAHCGVAGLKPTTGASPSPAIFLE
jgi:amidase